jgi:hypothetical protein
MPTIYPGDLVTLKSELLKEGESFKMVRSTLKAGDILRCIGTDGSVRIFVSKRTGTIYAFEMRVLAAKFNAVGFDGLESIDAPAPNLKQVVLGSLYPAEVLA